MTQVFFSYLAAAECSGARSSRAPGVAVTLANGRILENRRSSESAPLPRNRTTVAAAIA